jgi:hypothetical protein
LLIWYGQRFQDKVDGVGIVHRRREGQTLAFRTLDRTVFSIPEQVSTIRDVTLDLGLIAALLRYRGSSQASDWGRWQNAISCFNQANTDGQGTSPQLESVLMCSAFERLLDAAPKDKDVAKLLSGALIPSKTIPASESSRRVSRQADKNNSLRYEWMREFYTVRGNFAHGNFKTAQPMKWTPEEHLVLAAISFPLCVKVLLQRMDHYSMTDSDLIQTDAFEALANQAAFLGEPSDSTGSMDSWWARHLSEARGIRRRQKMVESLRALKGEDNG